MSKRSTAAVWVKGILEMLAAERLDVPSLLAAAGIEAAGLDAPGARLPTDSISLLWELAAERSGNPAIGLAQHDVAKPANFDVVGYTMMSCADLPAPSERLERYLRILSDALTMNSGEEDGRFHMTFELIGGERPVPRQRVEFIMVTLIGFLAWISGRDVRPVAVELPYPAPQDQAPYRAAFRCPLISAPTATACCSRAPTLRCLCRPRTRCWPSCTNAMPATTCAASITTAPATAHARRSSAGCPTASRGATRSRASCA